MVLAEAFGEPGATTMPTPKRDAPRQLLARHHQGLLTTPALWRALMTHKDWLVPSLEMVDHYDRTEYPEVYMFSEKLVLYDRYLFLFTDPQAAFLAQSQGMQLGVYAGGISGTELFENLNPKWEAIVVNPKSPIEETWQIPNDGFSSCS